MVRKCPPAPACWRVYSTGFNKSFSSILNIFMNKNMSSTKIASVLCCIALLSLAFASCKKNSPAPAVATGTFYFHIHSNIDTNEIDSAGKLYTDAKGRHFGLSVAQFYVSSVTLQNALGTAYKIPNAYILVSPDSDEYIIGTAPVGTYTSVTFSVGLDAAANASAPSGNLASAALSNATMWYGNTTQGYIFMKLQGTADTMNVPVGKKLVPFSYEIGSLTNLKTVAMPTRSGSLAPWVLTKDGTQYIHLICDYGKLLSVVNFKTDDSTDSYTLNPSTAATIANNIPNIFHYEE
jgi:hypothetical protein